MRRVHRANRLHPGSWPARSVATYEPVRVEQRLGSDDIQRMIREYENGATGRELAERFGVAKSTAIGLLRDEGVAVRHPRVSPSDVALAVEWYRQGVRQIDIAARLGRHKSVVWHLLRRAGAL